MPGLMALRAEYGATKPLKGARIAGCLHMTIQTAVLIETLDGARRRGHLDELQHLLDAGPRGGRDRRGGRPRLRLEGRDAEEYDWCIEQQLKAFEGGKGPNMILDDGGDLTIIVAREAPGALRRAPTRSAASPRRRRRACTASTRWPRRASSRCPAINVNDSVTKSKFDNLYGCRESLGDGIKRATDVMFAGKVAVVAGYGDVGKGCAQSLRGLGARVIITEIDPICALQAAMEGYEVDDDGGGRAASATSSSPRPAARDVIRGEHMKAMKDEAILCNIGHFDSEIQIAWLEKNPEIKEENIKPQVDHFIFPDGKRLIVLARGRLVNLGCATGHPSFVMSDVVHEPGARADRALDRTEKYAQRRARPAEEARREGRRPPPRQARREADQAHQGAGRVPRRPGRGAVQARALPLLTNPYG